eukprot:scaffold75355_cov57-Phaeocystis_antarctica.AAC.1
MPELRSWPSTSSLLSRWGSCWWLGLTQRTKCECEARRVRIRSSSCRAYLGSRVRTRLQTGCRAVIRLQVGVCVWLRLQATRARALLRDVARALAARTAARAADDCVDGADREEL